MTSSQVELMPRHRRFAPGWPLWVFTLALLPILVSLGFWQLERAAEKRELQARIEAQRAQPAVTITDLAPTADPSWRPLLLTGRFDPRYTWLLDNRTRDGLPGVEVLQVFHDSTSDQRLLINRGWLPWRDRRQPPAVPTPQGQLQLQVEVLPTTEPGFRLHSAPTTGWPKVVGHIDLPAFAGHTGAPLLPWMARLQPGSPAALRLDWPGLPMTATKHTGYAVQWFALAIALLILFVWAGLRPEPRGSTNDEYN